MAYEKLLNTIKEGKLPSIILICSEETFFVEGILKSLRSTYAAASQWSYEVVDAITLDAAKLTASAATLSFGGDTKLTVIRNSHKLKKDQLAALEKIAANPSTERKLVLLAEKTLKPSESVLKWAKANKVSALQLTHPKPKEIKPWLRKLVASKGFKISEPTLEFLIDLSGTNLMGISQMVTKIDLYRGDKKNIELEDVEDLLHDSFEKGVYECVNAVFAKNRKKAATEFHRVLRFNAKEGISQIVRSLMKEAFTLMRYIEMREKGLSREEMVTKLKLGARKWLLNKEYPNRIKKWTKEKLHTFLLRLADVDFSLRVTGRDAETMLEQVIIGNLAPTSVEEYDEIFV